MLIPVFMLLLLALLEKQLLQEMEVTIALELGAQIFALLSLTDLGAFVSLKVIGT